MSTTNPAPAHDPESNRMRFGCLAALVAVGILFFAFLMGGLTTYRAHQQGELTDPWGQAGPAQILEMPQPDPAPASPDASTPPAPPPAPHP